MDQKKLLKNSLIRKADVTFAQYEGKSAAWKNFVLHVIFTNTCYISDVMYILGLFTCCTVCVKLKQCNGPKKLHKNSLIQKADVTFAQYEGKSAAWKNFVCHVIFTNTCYISEVTYILGLFTQ